jgi:hypothetical protein
MKPVKILPEAIDRAALALAAKRSNLDAALGPSLPQYTSRGRYDAYYEREQYLKRYRQTIFLTWFGITLSLKIACSKAGIKHGSYSRWRRHDPEFMVKYNQVLTEALDELAGAVYIRAIGRHRYDDQGNVVTDPAGRPYIDKGSDKLAAALLQLPDDKPPRPRKYAPAGASQYTMPKPDRPRSR